ncbi:hypothetical protein SLEP1_g35112 [Rubroshorea leprosula]|uniref:Uncharacterized protein n=1 Tax=Rubroshorea leprosula TaxID=152421 RepID=A0AAV5KM81_9ROSI|nr:hypothetical protein SLEP1_g35112 [Rubroshorea leprosula]
MSSEGTVSIVGSEVLPLDYGSMDSESSPSPSSSEKTVEGVRGDEVVEVGGNEVVEVGGNEVVGVGGDSIPITVVEVEGRGERDYDVNAEIVEEANGGRGEGLLCSSGSLDACIFPLFDSGTQVSTSRAASSAQCIEAAELYGPSALSEAEMDQFLNTAGGAAIPKKPRKKSRTTSKQVDEGRVRNEVVPTTGAEAEEEEVPQLKRKGWEERRALQKKRKVVEEERGSKGPVPPTAFQSSLFEVKNMTGARWFINSTFPEVDKCNARDEALRYCGASVVKHVLESASWVNGLAQEFMDSVKERSLLISESEREAQAQEIKLVNEAFAQLKENVQTLVHNGMKEHISNFISSSSFDNIVNLYRLPTAIIAFTDCRKKVKAEYPEVDITKITFGEQEEGVEEDSESMSADFLEEEGAEVEEDEVEARVEGTEVDERQPVPEVEIHSVPSDDEQPPLPDEQQPTQPPLQAEQKPVAPPPPAEK